MTRRWRSNTSAKLR